MNVARWWATASEVGEVGQRLRWSEADVKAVPLPGWRQGARRSSSCPMSLCQVSRDNQGSQHPDACSPRRHDSLHPRARADRVPRSPWHGAVPSASAQVFFELGEEGLLWEDSEPSCTVDLLVRATLRVEPETIQCIMPTNGGAYNPSSGGTSHRREAQTPPRRDLLD